MLTIVRMSKRQAFIALLGVVLLAGVYFYVREQREASQAVPSATSGQVSSPQSGVSGSIASQRAVVPKNFQFALTTDANVDSLNAWLSRFAETDQHKLHQFSDRYYGVYNVTSARQVRWMEERGYPLPEDVIAASSLTTDELKEKAKRGNDKVKMLLFDRLIDEYAEKRDAFVASGRPRSQFNSTDGQGLTLEIVELQQQVENIDSPFAALVKTRNYELLENPDVITSDSSRIAGILAAHQLGDTRSNAMLQECISEGLCSAEDVEVATAAALSISNAGALNRAHRGCSDLPSALMPSN
jgi:hypothetical protein